MSTFDYGNARLHALRSRLLSQTALLELVGSGSLTGLLGALLKTSYRPAVEAALVRLEGLPCLMTALREDIGRTFNRLQAFYEGQAGRLVALLLDRYTIANLKTILRGLEQQLPADVILAATIPLGDLGPVELQTLAGVANRREAIDRLATWRAPAAGPLLDLQGTRPNASLAEREHALERWYLDRLAGAGQKNQLWQQFVGRTIDTTNLATALRLVGVAGGEEYLTRFFLAAPPAHLTLNQLRELVAQPAVPAAVARLQISPFDAVLREGLARYAGSPRLTHLTRALYVWHLRQSVTGYARDPLGIGTVIGYTALKENEIINLRLIGQALYLQTRPEAIVDELVLLE